VNLGLFAALEPHLLRHRGFVFFTQMAVCLHSQDAAVFVAEPAGNGCRRDEELIEIMDLCVRWHHRPEPRLLARKPRREVKRAKET